MKAVDETALFEVLNAKKMSPEEIGRTFVLLAQFDHLVGPDHSYLVGPRGSGKTTLLRMLQGAALMEWEHPRADDYRRRIKYSSVFLPADRLWVSQASLDNEVEAESTNPFSISAFCTQMLTALIETLQYRIGFYEDSNRPIHLPAQLSSRDEASLVGECAEAWRLTVRSNTLNSLLGALDLRLNNLATIMDPESLQVARGVDLIAELPWLSLSPIEAFRFGIRCANRYTRQVGHRWALLLDEMELAPRSVHRALTSALRGGERSLVLKLSFSPFDRYIGSSGLTGGAVEGNDFRAIYLWYGSKTGSNRFARGLWGRMSGELLGTPAPPVRVLGSSQIDVTGTTWHAPSDDHTRLIKQMYEADPSFAAYLKKRKLDVNNLDSLSYNSQSSTVRKMYPLLVFRDALLTFKNGRSSRRSRKKVTEIFTGADAIFAALEGNPRWMKAVFSNLLANYSPGDVVDRGFQFDSLRNSAERFESLLRVLPGDNEQYTFSVLDLLDSISRNLNRRIVGQFTADPPLSFKVGSDVPSDVQAALKTALSAGAIVHLRTNNSPPVLSSLVGEKFRLAYLLCIRNDLELPLRLGKTIELSKILADEAKVSSMNQRLKSSILDQPVLPLFSYGVGNDK